MESIIRNLLIFLLIYITIGAILDAIINPVSKLTDIVILWFPLLIKLSAVFISDCVKRFRILLKFIKK